MATLGADAVDGAAQADEQAFEIVLAAVEQFVAVHAHAIDGQQAPRREDVDSLAAQDPASLGRLRSLKALGAGLMLDDFGTGYSSLSCLHQLPVDTVETDRSFVIKAERSDYHRALSEATVRFARTLRMSTVAAGIETDTQSALVQSLGCDLGQGYLYCRPMEAEPRTSWLTEREPARRAGNPHSLMLASGASPTRPNNGDEASPEPGFSTPGRQLPWRGSRIARSCRKPISRSCFSRGPRCHHLATSITWCGRFHFTAP